MANEELVTARFQRLHELAASQNHELRVVAFPGGVKLGQNVTVTKLVDNEPDLVLALDALEEYLVSDEATERGKLYAEWQEAKDAVTKASETLVEASRREREMRNRINDDIVDRLDHDADAQLDETEPKEKEMEWLPHPPGTADADQEPEPAREEPPPVDSARED